MSKKHEIDKISIEDKLYPNLLRNIKDPPTSLYCRGNIDLLSTFCIGVVGTRKLTSYGREATSHIIGGLRSNDITIVSGLALGIDTVAHQAALDNGLPTIAVLGTDIQERKIYPPENHKLANDILADDGLIISECAPNGKQHIGSFPLRNRIISGLSKGVLVVEAPKKSGALITTKYATEQNRDIFALPGNIFSMNSFGPNMLIQQGAKPVFSAEDIIGAYYQNLRLTLSENKHISTKNPIEKKILDILDEKGELAADDIIQATNLETSTALSALSILEIKNLIKNLGNGKYRIAKR